MSALALGKQALVRLAIYLVSKPDESSINLYHLRSDNYLVIVRGGGQIAATHFDNWSVQFILALKLPIAVTKRAEVVTSTDLHPDNEIGMIDNRHRIRLGVP